MILSSCENDAVESFYYRLDCFRIFRNKQPQFPREIKMLILCEFVNSMRGRSSITDIGSRVCTTQLPAITWDDSIHEILYQLKLNIIYTPWKKDKIDSKSN